MPNIPMTVPGPVFTSCVGGVGVGVELNDTGKVHAWLNGASPVVPVTVTFAV